MSLTTGARIGPYEIVAPIGAGGMGEVYRGRDSRLGRDVALKVLPARFSADAERMVRFQREAQVLASLNHPHIAALYGLEEAGGVRALVMELVEGPTLDERIRTGPIPLDEALPIASQVAEALEAAHERGIIHRDLKPANIKLTRDGAVKVLDFGLAKALDDAPAPGSNPANSPTLTMGGTVVGAILGTAAYMSPEQARGKIVDRRADIWAFGVVLMEMLTGCALYSGEAPETLAAVILRDPSFDALPASTPASIRRLLRRCLEKDPRRRLRDIGEARIAIEEAATEAPPAAATALAAPQRVLPWAVAAVAVICALALLYFRQGPAPERVLRYSIAAPEKGAVDSFAISPDGRTLAISAETGGKRQLWIRPLDALGPQALAGTNDATFPFWSTDSASIGFFAEGKLKKIAAHGGPAQTLCDAPTGRGGSWNREGIIIFANISGPVQRVAAAGGVPAAVNRADGNESQRFPLFLPDGRRFLYLSGEKDGLFVASLDSQPARRLLADHSSVAWLPPPEGSKNGYLLFVRESTLMAQPFDAQTLQPAGDLFPVAEQVSFGRIPGNALASISGNGVLVYSSGRDLGESRLVWYDRGGKALTSAVDRSRGFEFALSPDERTVATTRINASSGHSDIWLHDLARLADSRFTFHASGNQQPVWSPDGSRIIFSSTRGDIGFDLYVRDTSGAGQDDLLLGHGPSGNNKHASDWSRDGRFLLYADYTSTTRADLWVLPFAEGDRKPVPFLRSEFTETQGQFSPDSRWIAYASDESGAYEVYVRPFPPGAGKWKISIGGGQLPRWRRDGKELFYLSPDHKLMAVAVEAAPGTRPAFETAAPEALFDTHAASFPTGLNYFVYAVASDGKRFLVSSSTETAEAPLTVVVNWPAAVKK